MKLIQGSSCILTCVFLNSLLLFCDVARAEGWKEVRSKDGTIEIQSQIADTILDGGSVELVKYKASTQAEVSIDQFIAAMNRPETHQFVLENERVIRLKTISDHEWVFYYFFNFPWPMSDADCVVHITLLQSANGAEFVLSAAPSEYPMQKVKRMPIYNVKYTLQKINEKSSRISVDSEIASTMNAPHILVQLWFPEGPADLLKRVIKASQKPISP